MTATSPDYIALLHNYLSRIGPSNAFAWQLSSDGPAHDVTHHATATLNGQVIGQGQGAAKRAAKTAAAYHALRTLRVI
ncbi:unnamed protein product [Peniophora sp. CBMAI 1063]|nr:unnamed protein product [Peniophora sp. CBMAI 1063]